LSEYCVCSRRVRPLARARIAWSERVARASQLARLLKLKNVNVESETMRANAVLVRALKELFKLVFAAHLFACFMSYVSMEQHAAPHHGTDEEPSVGCDPAQCWWNDKWDDGHARQVSGITLSKADMAAR
jgi:hypothetical protein